MLTPAQLVNLKADILADPTLSQMANSPDSNFGIAAIYNTVIAPAYVIWRWSVPSDDVYNAITWANLTPQDAVPTDTALNVQVWSARSLCCQGKQFNLQTLLQGKSTVACGMAKVRAAFADALILIPSGNNGNARDAGSAAVNTLFQRNATRVEKLFATGGAGTAADPAKSVFNSDTFAIDYLDVAAARNG